VWTVSGGGFVCLGFLPMTQEGIGDLVKKNGMASVILGVVVLNGGGMIVSLSELRQALTEIHQIHHDWQMAIDNQKQMKADLARLLAK
jgi:hypothetical protein